MLELRDRSLFDHMKVIMVGYKEMEGLLKIQLRHRVCVQQLF